MKQMRYTSVSVKETGPGKLTGDAPAVTARAE